MSGDTEGCENILNKEEMEWRACVVHDFKKLLDMTSNLVVFMIAQLVFNLFLLWRIK